jgi:glycerophosphoryl diester phosphodiesterase
MTPFSNAWNAALAAFRTAWRELLAADILYKLLAVVLLLPTVALGLRVFLGLSGSSVKADQDILYFFLSPVGAVTLVVIAAGAIAVTALEVASLMTIGLGAREAARVSVPDALRFSLARAWSVIQVAGRLVVRVVLLALPFLAAAALVAWWLLQDHDINYYLANRPPEFLAAAGAVGLIVLGLLAVLIPRLVSWCLVLPLVLFENIRPTDSFAVSAARVRGNRWQVGLVLVSWAVASLAVSALVIGLTRGLGLGVTGALADNPRLLLASMAALLVGWFGITILVNVFTICLFALLVAAVYRRLGGREWSPDLVPARSVASGHRGWVASNALLLLFLAAAVLAVIAARTLADTAREQQPVTVTAHRGAAGEAPENTLASIRAALEQGADWVEIDVQENADGEVIVIHDSDFMKIAGNPLKVWDATSEDLAGLDVGSWFGPDFSGERIPTLREVLDLVRGRATLTIELKYYGHDEQLEQRVVSLVEAAGMADQVAIISLKYPALEKIRELRPEWPTGLLTARALGDLTAVDTEFLAVNTAIATRPFIRRAHAAGKEVFVWTVNDPVTMSIMAGRGADGLITDYPGLAGEVLAYRAGLGAVERLLADLSLAIGWRPSREDVARETSGVQAAPDPGTR